VRGHGLRSAAMSASLGLVLATSCDPVVGSPLTNAPKNQCGNESDVGACERYAQSPITAKPDCSGQGRCITNGDPRYLSYVLVVSTPSTSFLSPSQTFLVPASIARKAGEITLPNQVEVDGAYRATNETSSLVGSPFNGPGPHALPVRPVYFPMIDLDDGTRVEARDVGLPESPTFAEGQYGGLGAVSFRAFLPAGPYRRVVAPLAPYSRAFPPVSTDLRVAVTEGSGVFADLVTVGEGATVLDDPTSDSHTAKVKREAGLEGFVVFLRDRKTQRVLSSVRPLTGTDASARLDTIGENGPDGTLREGVEIVVAPDPGWVGVPTLVDRILAGAGFRLVYPALPPATVVEGNLTGEGPVEGEVTFESTGIEVVGGTVSSSLVYRTRVHTDAFGHFVTVLPPGNYQAYAEPRDFEKAFGKARSSVIVRGQRTDLVFPTRRKGKVLGKVRLADGRPLAHAEVLAGPSAASRSTRSAAEAPRPTRTLTEGDGSFVLALDEGEYDLVVLPEPGTGFPRLVSLGRPVGPTGANLEDLVVFAPFDLSSAIKDSFGRAIARALVRAFAYVSDTTGFVEVGQSLTDTNGRFEMLVGPIPK
jgi:hypothetical protein